ncbi:hypothetical protein BY996DRAFT_6411801 [Phakopsora pachyrhizi]|nr:hypothetical protein BY996DRAFT_6411801 [Phakopsora pachyrhizi]
MSRASSTQGTTNGYSTTTLKLIKNTNRNIHHQNLLSSLRESHSGQTHRPNNQTASHPDNGDDQVVDYDIVIVGGGVVGLTLANALASSRAITDYDYKILILDSQDLNQSKEWNLEPDRWSNRISSITNENLNFLEDIGVYRFIDQTRTNPVERMQVWDGISDARIIFDAVSEPSNNQLSQTVPQMARFVENFNLQRALLRSLDQKVNLSGDSFVKVLGSTKVLDISPDLRSDWPIVNLQNGMKFRARLLVGADGFNSPVKTYSKINSTGWNYDSKCLVGTLELEPTSFNHTAWQRFLTSGPLGFLPLSDRHASLAWSTKPKIAAGLKSLEGPTLARVINACYRLPHESVNYLLSRISSHSSLQPIDSREIESEIDWRSSDQVNGLPKHNLTNFEDELPPRVLDVRMDSVASFPLKMFHADHYVGTRLKSPPSHLSSDSSQNNDETFRAGESIRTVILGDAAHVLHPMAGQGLNMGLGDARELSRTIEIALENGQDIGGLTALRNYSRSRYLSNHLVMSTVDKLHKLYSVDNSPLVWLRSVGVEVLNEIETLKKLMIGRAGGTRATRTSGLNNNENFNDSMIKKKKLFEEDEDGKVFDRKVWSRVGEAFEGIERARNLVEGLSKLGLETLKTKLQKISL